MPWFYSIERVRVHSAGRSADLLLFFIFFKKAETKSAKSWLPFCLLLFAAFYSVHTAGLFRSLLFSEARFLLLKKTQLARPERLKEVKHRKTPHPHEATRSASRRDFVTELFVLCSFLMLHYFSSQRWRWSLYLQYVCLWWFWRRLRLIRSQRTAMKSELPTVPKVSTSTMFPTKECRVSYTDFIYMKWGTLVKLVRFIYVY